MAKSGKGRGKQPEPQPGGRARTIFERTTQFDRSVERLSRDAKAKALAAAQQFQREWHASATDEDITPGFDLKRLDARPGRYRVLQIRAGYDHRLAIVFLVSQDHAYWIHAWKKTRLNNRAETDLAQKRAKTLWDELEGKGDNA